MIDTLIYSLIYESAQSLNDEICKGGRPDWLAWVGAGDKIQVALSKRIAKYKTNVPKTWEGFDVEVIYVGKAVPLRM